MEPQRLSVLSVFDQCVIQWALMFASWNFLCFVFSFAMKLFGFGRFGSHYKNISQYRLLNLGLVVVNGYEGALNAKSC